MNYFAHGRLYVDHPYLMAGTAVPDWLNVIARRTKIRSKRAALFLEHRDQRIVALATGILCHLRDDDWFHRTRAFAELSWSFTAAIRDRLAPDAGFRPSFLGHILVELLLDAELIARHPGQLEQYYSSCEQLDPQLVDWAINQIAPRPVPRLAELIPRFSAERFLYDYRSDAKLLYRLNAVMRRVGLAELPLELSQWFPAARQEVRRRLPALLSPSPTSGETTTYGS